MEAGTIVQTGRLGSLFARPAGDTVVRRLARLNPLAILTACDVMDHAFGVQGEVISTDTPLAELLARIDASGRPLGVVEGGELVGQITRDSVLAALIGPTAEPSKSRAWSPPPGASPHGVSEPPRATRCS